MISKSRGYVWQNTLDVCCLQQAAERNSVFVAKGADTRAKNCRGQTALHIAARLNLDVSAALLVEGGADINAENDEGRTPLCGAARGGSDAMMQFLVDRGARIGPGWSPFTLYCWTWKLSPAPEFGRCGN
jgi:ankyrin repeat protein